MSKILAILKSAKKAVLIALLGLFVAYVFMYEYVPAGNTVIYKINRYTKEAYATAYGDGEWVKVK